MSATRPADHAAREAALDVARSFIVQAPAGSGKTELLIQRFLALLARVENPEEVVAITFTRKAAAEMGRRVVAALRRGLEPTPPEQPHALRTWELARAAALRDAELGWEITHYPARLRILTIDALCASITRQMPWLSRFGAQPATADDTALLHRLAARNTLTLMDDPDFGAQVRRVLVHLDNDMGRLEGLLARMLARREQWLRHIRVDDHAAWRVELEGALQAEAETGLERLRALLPTAFAEVPALADFAAANLAAEHRESLLLACAGLAGVPGTEPGQLPVWLGLAELLLTKGGEWRKQARADIGFPAPSKAKEKAEKERLGAYKERFAEAIAALSSGVQGEALRDALDALRRLPPPGYGDAQWQVVEALLALLKLAAAELTLVFQERGEVDFAEVALRALAALGEPENPTDLALALDHRIHHLLVDEFQDTSHGQYRLLEGLTAGWQRGDGRTLFLVGDPMQSIYRFREADVGLYLRARREGIGEVALEYLNLQVNFRSEAGVVAWVNDAFARVMPAHEEPGSGAVPYSPSLAWHGAWHGAGAGEAVTLHPQIGADPRAEGARVAALAREALAAGEGATAAILVRSRSHLAEILPALRGAGFTYQAVEIETLGQRPVVQDLLALTRALLHPADRVAWLALLRAPWCGLTLDDLHLLAAGEAARPLRERLDDEAVTVRLSADGRVRLARLRGVFDAAHARRRRLPLRAWVEGVWLALGGPATLREAAELEDARIFLDLLERLESGGGIGDFAALAEKVTELFARPDSGADPRLQVMTIHKSKGLEFDTVILPGLGRRPRGEEAALLLWRETPEGELLLAPIREAGESEEPIYNYLRTLEGREALHESGRLLYVAATRARRRLHLLGHVEGDAGGEGTPRAPATTTLLARLWPVVEEAFAAATGGEPGADEEQDAERGTEAEAFTPPPLRRLPAGWRAPEPAPDVAWRGGGREHTELPRPEFCWAGDTARYVGDLVHRVLQRMGEEGIEAWDAARVVARRAAHRAALERLGVPPGELEEALVRSERALLNVLEDGRGRWILTRHVEARSELALSGRDGGELVNIVMDRTFVDAEGVRWIIDYKSGSHEGGRAERFLDEERERYRGQLERYARMFAALESRPIRLGLYFPLMKGWREWPAPPAT